MDSPYEIVRGLFLSGRNVAEDMKQLRGIFIERILNLSQEHPPIEEVLESDIQVKHIPILDSPDEARLLKVLPDTFDFIEESLRSKKNILVHCSYGISRSAAVVIYYYMKSKGVSLREAFDFVRGIKRNVWPNHGFMQQLIEAEMDLRKSKHSSMNIKDYKIELLCCKCS